MKRLLVSTLVLGALTLSGGQTIGADLVIDNFGSTEITTANATSCINFVPPFVPNTFNTPCLLVSSNLANPTESISETDIAVVGGTRQTTLIYEGAPDFISILTINDDNSGQLALDNDASSRSTATVTWDGGGGGLGNFSAYEKFDVGVSFSDVPFNLTLTVNGQSVTKNILPSSPIGSPQTVSFLFSEFSSNTTFFNSVSSIVMMLDDLEPYDVNITLLKAVGPQGPITDVPEPSLWLGCAIIFLLEGWLIKNKK